VLLASQALAVCAAQGPLDPKRTLPPTKKATKKPIAGTVKTVPARSSARKSLAKGKASTASKSGPRMASTAKIGPKPGVTSGAGSRGRASKSSKSSTKKGVAVAPHRSAQLQPTSDRYREIQQSLVDHGYFAGPADGNWGPDSVEALKRFQREQSLPDDGKIGALSLIALGLGPKRASIPRSTDGQPQDGRQTDGTLAEPAKTAP
jgi:eukaryotic-like serine/threonine-protein kinase